MKTAKNMDSVFANCTDSELEFDLMFNDDDSLIDLVAGVNEAGELLTGPNPEDTYEYQLDEEGNDLINTPSDNKVKGEPEGTVKNKDEEFESVEGMEKEIPGSNNSAESKADEAPKEIKEDASEEKLVADPENTPKADKADGPLKDDDPAERAGKITSEAKEACCEGCGKPMNECSCGAKNSLKEAILNKMRARSIEEAEVNVELKTDDTFEAKIKAEGGDKSEVVDDKDDADLRDGKETYSSNNVEAIKQKIIGAAISGGNTGDAIADNDDAESREGKNTNTDNVEAIKQKIIGAALKEDLTDAANKDQIVVAIAKSENEDGTVPDCVQTNGSSNNIVPDVETQSNDNIEPAECSLKDRIKSKLMEAAEAPDVDETTKIKKLREEAEEVVYKGWINNVTEAQSVEQIEARDDDDADIEAVANGKVAPEGKLDLSVDYDDDELIDMAINGKI